MSYDEEEFDEEKGFKMDASDDDFDPDLDEPLDPIDEHTDFGYDDGEDESY